VGESVGVIRFPCFGFRTGEPFARSQIVASNQVGVVGLGGLGSATAYWLASAGIDVIGFEQFELGHVRGASHDHSRIIRRSYHTPGYVDLTARAYAAWESVEHESGETIITRTGGVDLFPANAAIDPQPYRDSLDACGVQYDWIDARQIRAEWPAFGRGSIVSGDVMGIRSEDTGIVPAGRATAILQRLAVERGATLRDHSAVRELIPVGAEVDVVTNEGEAVRCGSVVICADGWTNRLLAPLGHHIPLAVTREQVTYLPSDDLDDLQPGRFPVWIWMDDPSYYGFPVYGQLDAAKGAEDCGGAEVDPDTRTFDPDRRKEAELATFMRNLVGDRFGVPRSTTCLYTLTSDRDFVVDRLPDFPQISVGLGAAHGFKFASWFGRELAGFATGATPGADLEPFSYARASLHQPINRAAWLV
jgi:sarcosine oxidase